VKAAISPDAGSPQMCVDLSSGSSSWHCYCGWHELHWFTRAGAATGIPDPCLHSVLGGCLAVLPAPSAARLSQADCVQLLWSTKDPSARNGDVNFLLAAVADGKRALPSSLSCSSGARQCGSHARMHLDELIELPQRRL
jgi:hypothetical protein